MLEEMVRRAGQTGADIVYCSYELVDEQGNKVCNDFLVPLETTFEESIVRSVITCSTVLVTAGLARENRFPTNMYHEDIAMWFRILRDGGVARGVPAVLAAYRQRAGSRSAGKLVSARRRWTIYRHHLKLPVAKCLVTMVRYGFYGIMKYKRVTGSGGACGDV
jgi:teichuronic acid biosynthesis glycosyltransferase TuaG